LGDIIAPDFQNKKTSHRDFPWLAEVYRYNPVWLTDRSFVQFKNGLVNSKNAVIKLKTTGHGAPVVQAGQ
jgi:hypothetical protein